MILLTVGMQLGFDRLIRAMDRLAPELGERIVAQVGPGSYRPQHMEAHERLDPQEFERLAREARLIVSHAGIGTLLTARRLNKPIVLFPREASLSEHRNDHQLATARQLADRPAISVAYDESELPLAVRRGLEMDRVEWAPPAALASLRQAVAQFIDE
ncbi:glycosyltransferase [Altererythrobacter sp.]|uniref:glycosyltransferase n=1 Tax=Altererythrobacter sp. TaxID=1872480 RepID=UPI003CFC4E5A